MRTRESKGVTANPVPKQSVDLDNGSSHES